MMQSTMFGIHDFSLFVTAGILLNVTPGADTMYIVGRSVAHGKRAGVMSVLGISSGSVVHTTAAALGLSAILTTSTMAFAVVRLAGAVYLVYLGVQLFRLASAKTGGGIGTASSSGSWAIYRQGAVTNLLNPKIALFYLAFLPQFVDPGSDYRVLAFAILGGVFILTGTMWCLLVAWFASSISGFLRESRRASALVRRFVGFLIVGLGIKLAIDS